LPDAKAAVTDTHKNGVKDGTEKTNKTEKTEKTERTGGTDKNKRRAKIAITDLLEPGAVQPKYEFEMELELRETGRGR
jgi:hypothetical protein